MKQLICPFAFGRNTNQPCIEENCALWCEKGVIEKETKGVNSSITTYVPCGGCAIKVLALK